MLVDCLVMVFVIDARLSLDRQQAWSAMSTEVCGTPSIAYERGLIGSVSMRTQDLDHSGSLRMATWHSLAVLELAFASLQSYHRIDSVIRVTYWVSGPECTPECYVAT